MTEWPKGTSYPFRMTPEEIQERMILATGEHAYELVHVASVLEDLGVVAKFENVYDHLVAWAEQEGILIDPAQLGVDADSGYIPASQLLELLFFLEVENVRPSQLEARVWKLACQFHGLSQMLQGTIGENSETLDLPDEEKIRNGAHYIHDRVEPPAVPHYVRGSDSEN